MSRKGKRILWFLLAAAIVAAAASQIAFLVRYPYFKEYAAINGLSLKEARKAFGYHGFVLRILPVCGNEYGRAEDRRYRGNGKDGGDSDGQGIFLRLPMRLPTI